MKKLLAIFLVMLPVVGTGQQQTKGQLINLIGMCVDGVQLTETTTKYGEVPFITMKTMRPMDIQMEIFQEYPTVLFMNPDTRTWTLAEKRGEDNYCVTGIGDNAEPYIDDSANIRSGT